MRLPPPAPNQVYTTPHSRSTCLSSIMIVKCQAEAVRRKMTKERSRLKARSGRVAKMLRSSHQKQVKINDEIERQPIDHGFLFNTCRCCHVVHECIDEYSCVVHKYYRVVHKSFMSTNIVESSTNALSSFTRAPANVVESSSTNNCSYHNTRCLIVVCLYFKQKQNFGKASAVVASVILKFDPHHHNLFIHNPPYIC